MDNQSAKELLKGLDIVKKQANNIINNSFNADIMKHATIEQREQIHALKKQMSEINKADLNMDSPIFKQFKK